MPTKTHIHLDYTIRIMNKLHHTLLVGAVATMFLSSCTMQQKVPYFVDAETIPVEVLTKAQEVADPVFKVGDLLNIQISGANMAAVAPFNKGTFLDPDGKIQNIERHLTYYGGTLDMSTEYYLINSDGDIDFPIIGKVKASGLTKNQVAQEIVKAIYPKFVTEEPVVDIRLMNFRVTVLGAVKVPGQYTAKNERMTFLEALSMAGDLDIRGDRENILLYRTNSDGTREVKKLDIHDKSFLLSPYYTLQQNDIIYVAPNKSMQNSAWQINPAVQATISIVGGMSSLASLVVGIVNLSK